MFGAALGPFRVSARIDQGGMGQVWQGVHVRSGLPVAVKLVRGDKPQFVEAFFDEVRAVARLDHPNVIAVLDCGRVEAHAVAASKGALALGVPWFAMEYCGGGQLSAAPCADWTALRTALDTLMRALAFAHARGVLHRDLTPENVLVAGPEDARPGLKLTDFGLGPALCAAMPRGTLIGTPAYMAPEQFGEEASSHGPWTDLYALGCLAWTLACGAPPFGRDRPAGVLALAHQELDLPPFTPRFEVPRGFESWLAHALEKNPAKRFRHAAEAAAALPAETGTTTARGLPSRWQTDDGSGRSIRLVDAGLGLWSLRPPLFVGRTRERDALWNALLSVAKEGTARLIHLTGPTGAGRSRLATWLAERACETAGCGSVVLRAGDSVVAAQAKIKATLREPLVLVLDDAHADPTLVSLAATVLRQRAGTPILLVVTTRSDASAESVRDIDALMAAPVSRRMELGSFAPADELGFLKQALGLGASLSARIRERVAGNPAYAVMLVGEAIAGNRLLPGSDGLDLPLTEPLRMPAEAQVRWTAEIERALSTVGARPNGTSRIALEAAAFLGIVVDEGEWNAVCQKLGIRPPTALVERLVRERFAVPTRRDDGRTDPGDALSWRFAHAQLRDALIAGAADAGRAVLLHRACASTLSAGRRGQTGVTERIGLHLFEAGDYPDALGWLVRGAKKSFAREDTGGAGGLLGHAELAADRASVHPSDERLGMVRTLRAELRIREADRAAGQRELDRVLEVGVGYGWRACMAEALVARAELHRRAGQPDSALGLLARARTLADELGDDALGGRATLVLAQMAIEMGEVRRAASLAIHAAEAAKRASDPRLRSEALAMSGATALRLGDASRAASSAKEALNIAAAVPHRTGVGLARCVMADADRAEERLDRATSGYQAALTAFESVASAEAVVPVARLAAMLLAQGRLEDAARLLAAGKREAHRHGLRGWRAVIDAISAGVAIQNQDSELAVELVESAQLLMSAEFLDADAATALEAVGVALAEIGVSTGQFTDALFALDMARAQWFGLAMDAAVSRVDRIRTEIGG